MWNFGHNNTYFEHIKVKYTVKLMKGLYFLVLLAVGLGGIGLLYWSSTITIAYPLQYHLFSISENGNQHISENLTKDYEFTYDFTQNTGNFRLVETPASEGIRFLAIQTSFPLNNHSFEIYKLNGGKVNFIERNESFSNIFYYYLNFTDEIVTNDTGRIIVTGLFNSNMTESGQWFFGSDVSKGGMAVYLSGNFKCNDFCLSFASGRLATWRPEGKYTKAIFTNDENMDTNHISFQMNVANPNQEFKKAVLLALGTGAIVSVILMILQSIFDKRGDENSFNYDSSKISFVRYLGSFIFIAVFGFILFYIYGGMNKLLDYLITFFSIVSAFLLSSAYNKMLEDGKKTKDISIALRNLMDELENNYQKLKDDGHPHDILVSSAYESIKFSGKLDLIDYDTCYKLAFFYEQINRINDDVSRLLNFVYSPARALGADFESQKTELEKQIVNERATARDFGFSVIKLIVDKYREKYGVVSKITA